MGSSVLLPGPGDLLQPGAELGCRELMLVPEGSNEVQDWGLCGLVVSQCWESPTASMGRSCLCVHGTGV